jgi:hypothetical protein
VRGLAKWQDLLGELNDMGGAPAGAELRGKATPCTGPASA